MMNLTVDRNRFVEALDFLFSYKREHTHTGLEHKRLVWDDVYILVSSVAQDTVQL